MRVFNFELRGDVKYYIRNHLEKGSSSSSGLCHHQPTRVLSVSQLTFNLLRNFRSHGNSNSKSLLARQLLYNNKLKIWCFHDSNNKEETF